MKNIHRDRKGKSTRAKTSWKEKKGTGNKNK